MKKRTILDQTKDLIAISLTTTSWEATLLSMEIMDREVKEIRMLKEDKMNQVVDTWMKTRRIIRSSLRRCKNASAQLRKMQPQTMEEERAWTTSTTTKEKTKQQLSLFKAKSMTTWELHCQILLTLVRVITKMIMISNLADVSAQHPTTSLTYHLFRIWMIIRILVILKSQREWTLKETIGVMKEGWRRYRHNRMMNLILDQQASLSVETIKTILTLILT